MKTTLTSADLLEDIAGAPEDAILTTKPLGIFSIAQRFFWVAQQETMRDQAVPTPFSESSISTCQRCIARETAHSGSCQRRLCNGFLTGASSLGETSTRMLSLVRTSSIRS